MAVDKRDGGEQNQVVGCPAPTFLVAETGASRAVLKRAKVLYISPVGERGGAEVLLLNLLKYHNRGLFDVITVFLKPGPLISEVQALGIETVLIESGRFREVWKTGLVINRLCKLILDRDVDMIASNMPLAHLYGGLAARLTRRKCVLFVYGMPSYWPLTDWIAFKVPTRGIFAFAEVVSGALRKFLPKHYHEAIKAFPMGVDLSKYDPSLDGAGVRTEFGITRDAPVIGMIARFERWKGQGYFIRAAALVRRKRPEARFLLVGDTLFGLQPEFKQELVRLVHELDLADSVIFAGFRNDLPGCLAAMDIVVEGYVENQPGGLVVLEAMAMSKPVIATDCGDRSEWMVPGETGLLIPPRDPERMASAVLGLLDSRELAKRMGMAGRRRIEAQFSVQSMVAHIERYYTEILKA